MGTREERLVSLLERWHEGQQRGQPVAVTELCAGCPELAADLERQIALHHRLEGLARPAGPQPDVPHSTLPPSTGSGPEGLKRARTEPGPSLPITSAAELERAVCDLRLLSAAQMEEMG